MRERRDDRPQTSSPLCGGRTADEKRAATSDDFWAMAGGENPGPGGQEKNWAQCLVDDLKVFRATRGAAVRIPLKTNAETKW